MFGRGGQNVVSRVNVCVACGSNSILLALQRFLLVTANATNTAPDSAQNRLYFCYTINHDSAKKRPKGGRGP